MVLSVGSIFDSEKSEMSTTTHQHLATTSQIINAECNYWRVKEPHGEPSKNNQPVHAYDIIRLEHVHSHLRLHSHGLPARSPLSKQQEVTVFGIPDENDNWQVEPEDRTAKFWHSKTKFKLIHVSTTHPLHSQPKYPGEVVCLEVGHDTNELWIAEYV